MIRGRTFMVAAASLAAGAVLGSFGIAMATGGVRQQAIGTSGTPGIANPGGFAHGVTRAVEATRAMGALAGDATRTPDPQEPQRRLAAQARERVWQRATVRQPAPPEPVCEPLQPPAPAPRCTPEPAPTPQPTPDPASPMGVRDSMHEPGPVHRGTHDGGGHR